MVESNITHNMGKAKFEINVIGVDLTIKLPKAQFAANLNYQEPGYKVNGGHIHPQLTIASLMLLLHGGKFSHVGMTVYVADEGQTPSCIAEFWPLAEYVPATRFFTKNAPPLRHTFRAEGEEINFLGWLQRVSPSLADNLRAHIGAHVPETIRQIFWSEGEIAQIEANALAQQRYEKLAQELIDSLYE